MAQLKFAQRSMNPANKAISQLWKTQAPRLLAALVQRWKDINLAEDGLAEAFAQALEWGENAPKDQTAWLYCVANNAVIDTLRTQNKFKQNKILLHQLVITEHEENLVDPDARLAMFFLCAHPALSADSQAMMMLRYCAGIDTADIAMWFGMEHEAVTRRLHRSKTKIQQTNIKIELPAKDELSERLSPLLSTLEILYDQSYSNIGGGAEQNAFAQDAEQLVLSLLEQMPDQAEVYGLAAMILFAESRRPARLSNQGAMIPLDQQDASKWDQRKIALGAHLILSATRIAKPGPYQIRAQIFAQHALRAELGHTPWQAILALYDALLCFDNNPQVQINRAIVTGHLQGSEAGMKILHKLQASAHQPAYYLAMASLQAKSESWSNALTNLQLARNSIVGGAELLYLDQLKNEWTIAKKVKDKTLTNATNASKQM